MYSTVAAQEQGARLPASRHRRLDFSQKINNNWQKLPIGSAPKGSSFLLLFGNVKTFGGIICKLYLKNQQNTVILYDIY